MAGPLTYARAAAPLVPFASRLPFVAGGGGEMPDIERVREDVAIDRRQARRVRRGLRLRAGRRAARHLPARARLRPAHGADDRRALPVRPDRPRAHRQPDRAAPPDRRGGAADAACPSHPRRAAPARPRVLDRHRGVHRRRAVWEETQHDAAPRWRRGRRTRRPSAPRTRLPERRGVAPGRRPRPPLRGRLRRPQPDPPLGADRQGVRVPARDRPRDVDEGALRRRAGADRARSPSTSSSAGRSCCPAGSRSPPATTALLGARRRGRHPAPGGHASDERRRPQQQDRAAGAAPPRRHRTRSTASGCVPPPSARSTREPQRLPRRGRREPHVQCGVQAGSAGPPGRRRRAATPST